MRLEKMGDAHETKAKISDSRVEEMTLHKTLVQSLQKLGKGGGGGAAQGGKGDGGKGGKGKDGGKGKGGKGGKGSKGSTWQRDDVWPLDLVDASIWDASLAGKFAVAPDNHEVSRSARKPEYLLDKPLLHTDLQWPFSCSMCLKTGHHFMECGEVGLPATVQRDGSQDQIVTLRQLFKSGYAKADGTKA